VSLAREVHAFSRVTVMEVELAQRLKRLPPYLFADLRRKIAEARARGVDVISLGIGDPDLPTPDPVVEELCRAAADPADPHRHRYGCDQPVAAFPEAVRRFYARRHGVELAPDQVGTTMGSKDAIAKLPMAILDPSDVGIAPVPGYPTYNIGHVFAGAVTYQAPLLAENDFLVDFDAIPDEVRRHAKTLWINYPNNPTTATAPTEFFERAVEFGRRHDILIAHDAAYSENTYEGYRAPSIMQVPGAADVAVEFFSLSKAFSMTGWRAGCVVGNPSAVAALQTVKSNIDNGSPRAVQFAAAKALDVAEQVIPPLNAVYQRRRDMVVNMLNKAGWSIRKPKATVYVWAPVPDGYDSNSAAFAEDLLEKSGVVVTPGRGYGQWGEGFFRISLTYPDETLELALERILSAR
jgi:LL-diaminopimelate aminotransferase